jgi:teichuronic acid exporter
MAYPLRSKTFRALSWSFLESIGLQGVRLVIGIVLARLLAPEQFGLIGMLTIFVAVAQSFLDSGFGAALIQKREATPIDTCSIFYFNIVVGLAAAGLLCVWAPWIAAFYHQPILTPLTRALSLTIVINSFGMVQSAILSKQINFKTQTKASLIASVLSGIIGVTLAVMGFGVWSLVVQQIAAAFLGTVLLWLLNDWRPRLIFSFKSLREMFGFGSRLLASGLLNQIFNNIYLLIIGKLFSATDLGFFSRAKALEEIPSQTLSGMVGRVTFPVFSTIQDDPARLKRGLKKALTFLVMVNFPMMIGLAVVARPLVLVLLTEKWSESIPYLQLLCCLGSLYPLQLINLNILQSLRRSDLFLRLEIIKKVLIIISITITCRWGISAMIYGMIAISLISYYLNSYYTGVLIGYPVREQLHDLISYLIMAMLMGIAVYAAGLLPFRNPWSMLLVQINTGIIIYVCLCRLFRLMTFMEIWQGGWNKISFLRPGTAE